MDVWKKMPKINNHVDMNLKRLLLLLPIGFTDLKNLARMTLDRLSHGTNTETSVKTHGTNTEDFGYHMEQTHTSVRTRQ